MVVSFSLVLGLGILCAYLVHAKKLKALHLLTAALLGFYLASTGIAPQITAFSRTLESLVSSLRP